jgi:demethoxyubiquinone hydroxylase (CLK1/Coq7/Cat5 family)
MTLSEYAMKHGSRQAAVNVIDRALAAKCGLTASDLADTATYAIGLDEIEEIIQEHLEDKNIPLDVKAIKEIANETAVEMLCEEGYDMAE